LSGHKGHKGQNVTNPKTQTEGDTLSDARRREQAMREVLQVINQSRADEAPVFQIIMEKAALLCGAPMAGLAIVNEGRSHMVMVAHWGEPLQHLAVGVTKWDMDVDYLVTRCVRERRVLQVENLAEDPLTKLGNKHRAEAAEGDGVRTFLAVPLFSQGIAIGCFGLYRREIQLFSDAEIELVETFAEHAAIAIENTRQFRELQTRLEREAASREILGVISQSREDETPVFDVILKNAATLSGAPLANLCLLNAARSHWHLVAHFGDALRHLTIGKTATPLESELVPAVAIRTARVVQIEDLTDTDLYRQGDPGRVAMVEVEGMRTILCIPLLNDAGAIGCITLFRREVKAFTADEIALVETFAAQAVIAIENVRQFRELRVRLERESATREILEIISQSRDDERPVFETILKSASRICNAPLAFVSRINDAGSHLHIPAQTGARDRMQKVFAEVSHSIEDSGIVSAHAVRTRSLIHVEDMATDTQFDRTDPRRAELIDFEGVRSYLVVPMVLGDRCFGTINLYRREVAPFTQDEISLVKTFAEQAVIAIENTRQFSELQSQLEREAALREILEVISASRDDEQPVFEVILENAARLCDAPIAGLHLVNEARTVSRLTCLWGPNHGAFQLGEEFELSNALAIKTAITEAKVVHVADLTKDPEYVARHPARLRMVKDEGVRTYLVVPLVRDGVAFGSINLSQYQVKPFSNADIELVRTFAEQAVIAIDNVRQYKELQKRTEEVEDLNTGLETRVTEQVDQLERLGRLRRFLSPQVADAVVSKGDSALLGSHRAMIAILFCDIRGFTAFCESAEPEETIEVLQTFHETLGKLIHDAGAGFDHRSGDGIMVIFNDPIPCDDPAGAALRVAFDMRNAMDQLCAGWRKLGHRLGFGVGISLGYATVGMVGFEGRYDYTASGTAVNLASRLCDHAADREILLSPRAAIATEDIATQEPAGDLTLKGFQAPVVVVRATELKRVE
jgi:GAF domain-containing protein